MYSFFFSWTSNIGIFKPNPNGDPNNENILCGPSTSRNKIGINENFLWWNSYYGYPIVVQNIINSKYNKKASPVAINIENQIIKPFSMVGRDTFYCHMYVHSLFVIFHLEIFRKKVIRFYMNSSISFKFLNLNKDFNSVKTIFQIQNLFNKNEIS